jgi:GT2 family glycosyltransferase
MIAYIILHYKNLQETKACMDSLFQNAAKDSAFVIVENGSHDTSAKELQDLYGSNEQVHLVILPENVGFSKGNNAGWRYVKEHLNPDFVVIANNDVIFYQKDFEQKIYEIYESDGFDVLGPDIYVPRYNNHQNPLYTHPITKEEIQEKLALYEGYQKHPHRFFWRLKAHYFKDSLCTHSPLFYQLYSKIRKVDFADHRKKQSGIVLQGACLIFSKRFFEQEEKVFDPEPFLYCEEIFLYLRAKQKGYVELYSPDLAIHHMEGASFEFAYQKQAGQMKFMLENHVKAHQMVLDYMQKESL